MLLSTRLVKKTLSKYRPGKTRVLKLMVQDRQGEISLTRFIASGPSAREKLMDNFKVHPVIVTN